MKISYGWLFQVYFSRYIYTPVQRRLHQDMSHIWFYLVDRNGNAYQDCEADAVGTQEDARSLKDAIKQKCNDILKEIAPSQLKVYSTKEDAINGTNKLEPDAQLGGHDKMKNALYIVVPVQPVSEFLRTVLQPLQVDNIRSPGPSTRRGKPKAPRRVHKWNEFGMNATEYPYPTDAIPGDCIIPATQGKLIRCEKDVETYFISVLESLNYILAANNLPTFSSKAQYLPDQDIFNKFAGEADRFMCISTEVYGFAEFKTPWAFQSGNLRQLYKEDLQGHWTGRNTVEHIIEQVYGYLSFNKLKYGFVSSYNATYFLCRPEPGLLLISDVVKPTDNAPTLLQCLYYLTALAKQDHTTIPSQDYTGSADVVFSSNSESNAYKSYSTSSTTDSHDVYTEDINILDNKRKSRLHRKRNKKVKPDAGNIISNISPSNIWNRRLLGHGAGGQVFAVNNNDFVIKVADINNNPDAYQMLLHEIQVYEMLSSSGITCVPNYYFNQALYGQHFLVLEYIHGTHCDFVNHKEMKSKLQKCIASLESIGIFHLDIRPENVIWTIDNDIKIIDFGMSKINK